MLGFGRGRPGSWEMALEAFRRNLAVSGSWNSWSAMHDFVICLYLLTEVGIELVFSPHLEISARFDVS